MANQLKASGCDERNRQTVCTPQCGDNELLRAARMHYGREGQLCQEADGIGIRCHLRPNDYVRIQNDLWLDASGII